MTWAQIWPALLVLAAVPVGTVLALGAYALITRPWRWEPSDRQREIRKQMRRRR